MQPYSIVLAPGASAQFAAAGTYFRYMASGVEGADDTIIVRRGTAGETVALAPGQAFEWAVSESQWTVTNPGLVAMTVQFLIGSGRMYDNRIKGEVAVIDGGRARTLAGETVMGAVELTAPGSGSYRNVQLLNPAGSGVLLELFWLRVANGAVAGLVTCGVGGAVLTFNGGEKMLKRLDSASSSGNTAAQLRYQNAVATGLIGGNGIFWNRTFGANQEREIRYREPITIAPGYGFQLSFPNNSSAALEMEWAESPQ